MKNLGTTEKTRTYLKKLGIYYDYAKPVALIEYLIKVGCQSDGIVLDFFAGSGTTAEAVGNLNASEDSKRRFICVQLPEKFSGGRLSGDGEAHNLADIAKNRIRIAFARIRNENPMLAGDLGFRVFKLASSNIQAWEPHPADLPKTLQDSVEHLKSGRTDADILFELLLKLGLDLTVQIEEKAIAGETVHSIGAGSLMVCLANKISSTEVESIALGMVAWHKQLEPAGVTSVVFRDSAFADDVAKTNLTAILQQHGLENVRSL